jgi:cell division septal protein FtsQ
MSQRGSWYLELNNDLIVLLGRKDILNRIQKFVSFFADYGSELNKTELNTKNITYIDMRYNNGLAVGTGIKQNLIELMETA